MLQVTRPRILVSNWSSSRYPLTGSRRDAVATDIVHQHSGRLDYYKGCVNYCSFDWIFPSFSGRNFTQFYSTKSERDRNLRKEYETQMEYRKNLQAFVDRWRYNANRGLCIPFLSEWPFDGLHYSSLSSSDEAENFGKGNLSMALNSTQS